MNPWKAAFFVAATLAVLAVLALFFVAQFARDQFRSTIATAEQFAAFGNLAQADARRRIEAVQHAAELLRADPDRATFADSLRARLPLGVVEEDSVSVRALGTVYHFGPEGLDRVEGEPDAALDSSSTTMTVLVPG